MYTYIIETQGYYKVGVTKNIVPRIESYRTHNPMFTVARVWEGNFEVDIQVMFKDKISHREWMKLSAGDIQEIDQYVETQKGVSIREFYMIHVPVDNEKISIRIQESINKKEKQSQVIE